MAESVFSFLLRQKGIENVSVSSAATHTDEIGNPPHYGTREKLQQEGIPVIPHRARLLTLADGETYDFIIGMDEENLRHMRRILGKDKENKITGPKSLNVFGAPYIYATFRQLGVVPKPTSRPKAGGHKKV